jgi:hypothetical protein
MIKNDPIFKYHKQIKMATIYPKDFYSQTSKRIKKASCFVLMSFNPSLKEVFETIKETLESDLLNIECNRADDFHQPQIMETILKGIAHSEYIIADLTDANSNVFYELGLAHMYKNMEKVIILTQKLEFVPFDLRQFRCIVYEQSIAGSKRLKDELVKTFEEVARNSFRIRLKENKIIPFSKRIIGRGNYLYELSFISPFLGHDAIKLQINFTQLAVDGAKIELENQLLYLSEDKPEDRINNIPWIVSLIKSDGHEATISIDKK